MADDRPVEDPTQQVARLSRELDDLKSTVLARLTRRPTGDVEMTIRETPKVGTLFLQGQTNLLRTDYPNLWAWAQDQGLVQTGLFTTGNGTTTFGLPNFAGRVPVGSGTLSGNTYVPGTLVGSASISLTQAQMPNHGGHWTGGNSNVGYPGNSDFPAFIRPEVDLVKEAGSNAPIDIRQPSVGVNWLIWT